LSGHTLARINLSLPEPVALSPTVHLLQIVVMGVSGCGKSTVGQQLALRLGCDFLEGDSLHPPRNVALMAAGTPLTDADRADWLALIAQRLALAHAAGQGLVVSCSALRRAYRDQLRAACPGLRWVHLQGSAAQLQARVDGRSGHYMPPSLLASQLATLEPPGADEQVLVLDIAEPAAALTTAAFDHLQAPPPQAPPTQ
jgi:gluconokinase